MAAAIPTTGLVTAHDDVIVIDKDTFLSGSVLDDHGSGADYSYYGTYIVQNKNGAIFQTKHGEVLLSPNGDFEYTPEAGFLGVDTFTYGLSPGFSPIPESFATVSIVVTNDHTNTIIGGNGGNDLTGTSGSDVMLGNGGKDYLEGKGGNDYLFGGKGDDTLDGGNGRDYMDGGEGDDTYYVNNDRDTVVDSSGDNDRVYTTVSYEVGDSIELLSVENTASTYDIDLTGSHVLIGNAGVNVLSGGTRQFGLQGDDTLIGTRGDDLLDGGAGADLMKGGRGSDIYIIDDVNDMIEESNRPDLDYAYTSVSYTLGAGVQVETLGTMNLLGTESINLTGNELTQLIIGNSGDNTLNGGGGLDILMGGLGNDTYIVNNSGAFVLETEDGGTDRVITSINYYLAANVENLETSDASGTDELFLGGNDLDNTITGNAGNNTLDGMGGADRMIGLGGDDSYYVDNANDLVIEETGEGDDIVTTSVSYALGEGREIETLQTTNEQDTDNLNLTGNSIDNTIYGNHGDNVINGKGGVDYMAGSHGNDYYYVDDKNDVVVEYDGEGTDRILSSTSYHLSAGSSIEWLSTANSAGTDPLELYGNEINNTLTGNAGNNLLDGGAGVDTMAGGLGDDSYYVDNAGDVVQEASGAGNDTIYTSVNYTIGINAYVETLSAIDPNAVANLKLTGNALDNTIIGDAGNNIIDGKAGADTMAGNKGDDNYYVDNANDVVTEYINEGNDRIFTSVTYGLAAGSYVEWLSTTNANGLTNLDLTGNEFKNTLSGNAGDNILDGGAGADVMVGFGGNDTYYVDNTGDVVAELINGGTDRVLSSANYTLGVNVYVETLQTTDEAGTNDLKFNGNAFDNTLIGNAGANTLTGNAGNDVLDGKAGADRMVGGTGDDYFYVDNSGDVVVEADGEGTDRVLTGTTYALATGASIEVFSTTNLNGMDAINLYGNEIANTITGNAGVNVITGGKGNDLLLGAAGNDILYGDDDNDNVNGGTGTDTMYGGMGDDVIYVDDANDVIVEYTNEGFDRALASVTYGLAAGVSVEWLTTTNVAGTDNINLYGNELVNTLSGNAGNNLLAGGVGADTMVGMGGDDIYYVDNAGDVVMEGINAGEDTIRTSVNYTIGGSAYVETLETNNVAAISNLSLTGNVLDNTIIGNAGNNIIDGKGGVDVMTGGLGNDNYYVDNALDVVNENLNEGSDRVYTSVTYGLAAGSHVEWLSTANASLTTGINLYGNEFVNTLSGNAGNNLLDGGVGADTMAGGLGNDNYYIDNAGDVIQEANGAGFDQAFISVDYTLGASAYVDLLATTDASGTSNINLTGNGINNTIIGNAGNNTLSGAGGNDVLDGNGGTDYLVGGAGMDTFQFTHATAYDGADTVADFSHAQSDHINIADLLGGYDPMQDAIDNFVTITSNAGNTLLSVDQDGTGSGYGATAVATITGNTWTDLATMINNGDLIIS